MIKPLFKNVDCISFYVDNLDEGIDLYVNKVGLKLLWRTASSCGLGLVSDITEVVLVNEHNPVVDFLVDNVETSLEELLKAGFVLTYGPFDIDIGKCAVVKDKWDNTFCILDMRNGTYQTDDKKEVIGLNKK